MSDNERRLPNASRALITNDKLFGWILSEEGHGANFAAWGYTLNHAEDRADELVKSAQKYEHEETVLTKDGVKYNFYVFLPSPSGRFMRTIVVWQIDHGDDLPRLITAYPARKYIPVRRKTQ